jgi:cell division protein FtsI (penicillin-binding protein 3)
MTTIDAPIPSRGAPDRRPIWSELGRRIWAIDRAFERAKASGRAEDDTRLRVFFVMALFAAGFLALGLAATKAALFSGLDEGAGAESGIPNARGDLVDRNGQLLAMDLVHYGLYLSPREVADPVAVKGALMSQIPGLTGAHVDQALAGANKRYYLAGGLTPDVRARLHDMALAGVTFEEESGRAYPLGSTGAHVIGFADKDGRGLAGAERAFDSRLRAAVGKAPLPLSIDLRVQGALQNELNAAASAYGVLDAVGVVVNVRTGEILGMASYPAFDPNQPGRAAPAALVNHAAATVYEPGSVFKVFTLAMGLDSGVAKTTTPFDVHTPLVLPGQTIHDFDKGDRVLPLSEVFTHSSNIGAARLALLAGADRMEKYFHAFGLFEKAPSELAESARPLVVKRLTPNAVATMGFGHSISVSPLALATGMSAILNGGVYRPLTLRKLDSGAAPRPGVRVVQESTSRTMLDLMRLNVTDGTGRKADVPGYRVGGKTGTATKIINGHYNGARKNLASFAGVFPADGGFDQDRYFVLIMMDEPHPVAGTGGVTTGGIVAAPVVGQVVSRIAPFLNVRREIVPESAAKSDSGAKLISREE